MVVEEASGDRVDLPQFTVRLLERTASLGTGAEASLRELKTTQLIFERSLYPEHSIW